MNNFYMEAEPKLFCVLIIAFLYAFQRKTFQYQCRENKLLYFFSFVQIFFLVLVDVVQKEAIQNLCYALCGISYFLAMYFCFAYAFKITGKKTTIKKKGLSVFACIIIGTISFCLLRRGINAPVFVLTFVVITLFVIEEHNKIRVDNLTKLYNRYGMDVELKEQIRQYQRENSDSFYIIACDLDNFKYINDTWGHPEGDRALVLIAGALAKVGNMFSSNVFRIGGDEFIIITDTSQEGLAIDITNAIKTELDNIEFRDDFDIKVSIGTALYDGRTSIDELLNSADKKMYEAKKNRRI